MRKIFNIISVVSTLLLASCQTDPEIPVFTGQNQHDDISVAYTNAHVCASFAEPSASYTYNIRYSIADDLSSSGLLTLVEDDFGNRVGDINNLEAGKKYFYQYEVKGAYNSYFSNISSFTTTSYSPAVVTIDSVRSVTYTNATINASLHDWGCEVLPEWGICYGTSPEPAYDGLKQIVAQDGSQVLLLDNLQDGTIYYARVFANSKFGITYGNEISFTTRPYVVPELETHLVSNITATAAVCSGKVIYDGGKAIIEKGICFSTSDTPTISDNKVAALTSGLGAYSCLLDNLVPNTTYYIRAYAINEKGIGYGEQITFTTLE